MISIIIPYKNAMPFFEDCLNSIIDQTYSNFELILVNDHSNDNSENIAKKYQLTDKRIKSIKSNGNGIIAALISGAKIIKGDYITRMDADDIMKNDKLELNENDEKEVEQLGSGRFGYKDQKELDENE